MEQGGLGRGELASPAGDANRMSRWIQVGDSGAWQYQVFCNGTWRDAVQNEREVHRHAIRQALASMETDSLYKCVRYVASNRGLTLCGSARMFVEDSKLAVCRGNIFYWLENDAPLAWLEWLSNIENFCRAIQSNA